MESIFKTQREQEFLDLCEERLRPLGFRPVDLDVRESGRSLVRLFIERLGEAAESGATPGATIEDCAQVSRELGTLFDERVPGAYDLEVSSPGLDRRLRLRSDFERMVGQEVRLRLTEKLPGRGANLTGTLRRVDNGLIVVDVDREEVPVPLAQVAQAVRVWRF